MHRKLHLAVVTLVLGISLPLSAGEEPIEERGFSAESVYQMGEIDSVNLYNGNLTLSIPLGPTYPVNNLSYGLHLTYNSNAWDVHDVPNPSFNPADCERGRCAAMELTYPLPNSLSNAGLGWTVTLGQLHQGSEEGSTQPPPPGAAKLDLMVFGEDGVVSVEGRGDCVSTGDSGIHCEYWTNGNEDHLRLSITGGLEEFRFWEQHCADSSLLDNVVYDGTTPIAFDLDMTDENGDPTDRLCGARFVPPIPVSFTSVGPDWGWVEEVATLPRISCGYGDRNDCSTYVEPGEAITFRWWAEDGYRLVNWGGSCEQPIEYGEPTEITIQPFEAALCTAQFAQCGEDEPPTDPDLIDKRWGPKPPCSETVQLTAEVAGSGGGSLESHPDYFTAATCNKSAGDPGPVPCGSEDVTWGSWVRMTADPDEGSFFSHWALPVSGNPLSPPIRCVPLDASEPREATSILWKESACQAVFEQIPVDHGVLRVRRTGDGLGRVASMPAGIDCGEQCEHAFPVADPVQLEAIEVPGLSRFEGWSGDCSGIDPVFEIDLAIDEVRDCTAEFSPINQSSHDLSVAVDGPGSVLGLTEVCGQGSGTCTDTFQTGSYVELVAEPLSPEDHGFVGWSGDCSTFGLNPRIEVFMDGDKSCTAHFNDCSIDYCPAIKQLNVAFRGDGEGEVVIQKPGQPDTVCTDDCSVIFGPTETEATLVAQGDDSDFEEFLGVGCTGDSPLEVDMSDHRFCKAYFGSTAERRELRLEITREGTARAELWSNPEGIHVPLDSNATVTTHDFPIGTDVDLHFEDGTAPSYVLWGGDCSASGEIDMLQDAVCTAHIRLVPTISVQPNALGSVEIDPGNTICLPNQSCTEYFDAGSTVFLTVLPEPDAFFTGWGGDPACSDLTAPVATVTLWEAMSCTATFGSCPGGCGDPQQLTITDPGNQGTVISVSQPGIDCPGDCSEMYPDGLPLVLRAEETNPNYFFHGWTGCPVIDPGDAQTTIIMNQPHQCTAVFADEEPTTYTLTAQIDGGGGSVLNLQGDIDCPGLCQEVLNEGSTVSLLPIPDPGKEFSHWVGGCPGNGLFQITSNTTCTAKFVAGTTFQLTIDVGGQGADVLVAPRPSGTSDCAADPNDDCTYTYNAVNPATVVELEALDLAPTVPFLWWSGDDCDPTSDPRVVTATMNQSRSCMPVYGAGCPECIPPGGLVAAKSGPSGTGQAGKATADDWPEGDAPDVPYTEPNVANRTGLWMYVSPDGAKHYFYRNLQEHLPDHDELVYYTRDNSFLRLTVDHEDLDFATAAKVEFPDGTFREFSREQSSTTWRLDRLADPFGNEVTIDYSVPDEWRIEDSEGRSHRILFSQPVTPVGPEAELGPQIERIDLAAFDGAVNQIEFEYDSQLVNFCYRNRLQEGFQDMSPFPAADQFPMLSEVRLGAGQTAPMVYRMESYRSGTVGSNPGYSQCPDAGVLESIELPTGGRIEWDYGSWKNASYYPPFFHLSSGVSKRTFVDPHSGDTTSWTYSNQLFPPSNEWRFLDGVPQVYPTESRVDVAVESVDGAGNPVTHCTRHYFNADETDYAFNGLPFSPTNDAGDLFLSTEVFGQWQDQSGDPFHGDQRLCAGMRRRTTHTRYEVDGGYCVRSPDDLHDPCSDRNRRVVASETVFHGDADRSVRTDHLDYNQLGRFETTVVSGWGGLERTTKQDYTVSGAIGPDQDWFLDLVTRHEVLENGDRAVEKAEFDDLGFKICHRTLTSGTENASDDLVTRFERGDSGNVARIVYDGGDLNSVSMDVCGGSGGDYAIDYQYEHGVLRSSQFEGASFLSYDVDVDPSTGLAHTRRDTGGLATTFAYDVLGRLVEQTPPGDATQSFAYSLPAGGPASVRMEWRDGATLLKHSEHVFDGFGRVAEEMVSRPNLTPRRYTRHNGLGWKISMSEWDKPNSVTIYKDFDPFGRAKEVVRPDDGTTKFYFQGERQVQRTEWVGGEESRTWEKRDALGRLVEVREPDHGSPDFSLIARYTYDIGDRLSEVELNESGSNKQFRTFKYDNRGFLLWQELPELEGRVEFGDYDARGNAHYKNDVDRELTFEFDEAGRPTKISRNNNPIKELDYFTSGYRNGRLESAIRYNFGPDHVRVTDFYDYDGSSGRVDYKATQIKVGSAASQTFRSEYQYDALGLMDRERYPYCDGCSEPWTDYEHKDGHLWKVRRGSEVFARTISYHPNGLYKVLRRDTTNGDLLDVQGVAADGMTRPSSLALGKRGSTLYDLGNYTYDGVGNILGVGNDEYEYDLLSRLTSASLEGEPQRTYQFDAFGNLVDLGGRDFPVEAGNTNRLADWDYDVRGNVILADGDFGTVEYDDLNMPWRRSLGDRTEWYAYSADNERVWTRTFIADGSGGGLGGGDGTETQTVTLRGLDQKVRRTYDRDGSTLTWKKDYFYRDGSLLASLTPEGRRNLHVDHLGTLRLVTDEAGNEVSRHKYWPFGETLLDTGTEEEVMQFTGHERDEWEVDTDDPARDDLDYMHARYYSGWAGRFLSVDPAGESAQLTSPQSWNRYSYAYNDPLGTVDPDGEIGFKLIKSAVKFAIKGGDLAATFAGVVEDFNTLRSDEASGGEKALAAVSLLTEIASPVSLRDAKAIGKGGKRLLGAADNVPANRGSIYEVPGRATSSGKPYVGRHNGPEPQRTRRSNDGRDRKQAEVIDTYDSTNTAEGRVKEQRAMDARGGVDALDNKRNEVAPHKMKALEKEVEDP